MIQCKLKNMYYEHIMVHSHMQINWLSGIVDQTTLLTTHDQMTSLLIKQEAVFMAYLVQIRQNIFQNHSLRNTVFSIFGQQPTALPKILLHARQALYMCIPNPD